MSGGRIKRMTARIRENYKRDGYVCPLPGLDRTELQVCRNIVDDHLFGSSAAERSELTDKIVVRRGTDGSLQYDTSADSESPSKLPFLINLWRLDGRIVELAKTPKIANVARTLLDSVNVLLFEDNVIVKAAGFGDLSWHQDFSYWPLNEDETESVVTVWVALDPVGPSNGGLRVAPGSHLTDEHLPVGFGDSQPVMGEFRPDVAELTQDPEAHGFRVANYNLEPGEFGIHHPLLWHGSNPNGSDVPRIGFVLRYMREGTIWAGNRRIPYDDIGCAPGDPVTRDHLPLI